MISPSSPPISQPINPTRPGFSISLPPFYIPCRRAQLLLLRSLFGLTFFLVQNCYLCAPAPHPSVRPSIKFEYQPNPISTAAFFRGGGRGYKYRLTARACPSGITSGTAEGRSPRNTRGVTVAADHCEQSTEASPPWKKESPAAKNLYRGTHRRTRVVQQTNA